MTICADASALIAIITGEDDADALADALDADRTRLCSALSAWETVAGLCRSHAFAVQAARAHVRRFLDTSRFRFVGIGEREAEIAAEAYARFGRGRRPAALNMGDCFAYACAKASDATLNMGDCFAYACAKASDATLLYKGYDFAKAEIG